MKRAVLFIIMTITFCRLFHAASMKIFFSLDCLTVPEMIKEGNASFYLVYRFKVNDEFRPTEIHKIIDPFIGVDKVKLCLKAWKFEGVGKNGEFTMVLCWKHSMGWTSLSIIGEDLDISIKL